MGWRIEPLDWELLVIASVVFEMLCEMTEMVEVAARRDEDSEQTREMMDDDVDCSWSIVTGVAGRETAKQMDENE